MEAIREIRLIDQAQVTFDLPQAFWGQNVEIIILPLPQVTPESAQGNRMEEARALMRTFGRGLGSGCAPHDAALRHDEYLSRRG